MNPRTLVVMLALSLAAPTATAETRVVRGPLSKESPACKADADCALLPTVCGRCPACEPTWHPVGTRKDADHIRNIAKRARCKAPSCGCAKGQIASTRNWLGNRAACRKGRCVAEHVVELDPNRACKVDADCAVRPRSGCGCPPCGVMRRAAVSRSHADWLRKEHARESCPPMECAKCAQKVVWVGERPVCRLGQCVMLP